MSLTARRMMLAMQRDGAFAASDVPQSEADALIALYDSTGGPSWSTNTGWLSDPVVGNWYGITVSAGHVTSVSLSSNNLDGAISGFDPGDLPSLTSLIVSSNSTLAGDVSSWSLPSGLLTVYLQSSSVSGDLSSWSLPSDVRNFYLFDTAISGLPDPSAATKLRTYRADSCPSLSQSDVDGLVEQIYTAWAAFTYATPTLNIDGTTTAPSGTYQDGDPPTTGKEYIYEIVNDPESTGNIVWTVTYTA